ncbi:DUF4178 domain-containing protein [Fibrivirga algicola]|uniref:DUF4178 domain-containing protein n=1 Tax=Fibrivirga algicola TaxID=2950420 RepID=A0ABX0QCI9_9BACT|nr:DUF4178 domain-containing protein [Fibrivirga algicola]NID10104.1 DUF4178 domain-containing protein [Fibrivirga algicola]
MTNSLPIDAQPWPTPDTVTCPNCSTELTYYDPNSSFYGCPTCKKLFKAEYDNKPEVIPHTRPNQNETIHIAIGTEGYLNGLWVRLVGVMVKQEKGTNYQWREYILLLKDATTRQLAEFNGHWMWIGPAANPHTITTFDDKATFSGNDDEYRLYARYQAELITAVGEFDWNMLDDESLTIEEYINPPKMLVNEKDNRRNDWYEATYLSKKDVTKAFGLDTNSLPDPYGVGAIQPNNFAERWPAIWQLTLLAIVAVIGIHVVNLAFRPAKKVHTETLTSAALFQSGYESTATRAVQRSIDSAKVAQTQPTPKMVRTQSFVIDGPTAVDIDFRSDVDNTWVEFATELVNEQTNQRYIFTEAVEYYHGYSDGENWTEGGTESSATLSKIPTGQYHMEITPYTQYGQPLSFSVKVGQNTSLISNVLLLIGLLALYPIYILIRGSGFETLRWQQSDFGPQDAEE